jgi:hypothetical protein
VAPQLSLILVQTLLGVFRECQHRPRICKKAPSRFRQGHLMRIPPQ